LLFVAWSTKAEEVGKKLVPIKQLMKKIINRFF